MPSLTVLPKELVLGLPLAGPLRTLSPPTNEYYEAGFRRALDLLSVNKSKCSTASGCWLAAGSLTRSMGEL